MRRERLIYVLGCMSLIFNACVAALIVLFFSLTYRTCVTYNVAIINKTPKTIERLSLAFTKDVSRASYGRFGTLAWRGQIGPGESLYVPVAVKRSGPLFLHAPDGATSLVGTSDKISWEYDERRTMTEFVIAESGVSSRLIASDDLPRTINGLTGFSDIVGCIDYDLWHGFLAYFLGDQVYKPTAFPLSRL